MVLVIKWIAFYSKWAMSIMKKICQLFKKKKLTNEFYILSYLDKGVTRSIL